MSTSTIRAPSFSLNPATPSDIPALAKIFTDGLVNDRVTQLKSLGKDSDYVPNMIKDPLAFWITNSRFFVVKATDDVTGEIIGWVGWGHHGYEEEITASSVKTNPEVIVEEESKVKKESRSTLAHDLQKTQDIGPKQDKTPEDLGALTASDMKRWQKVLMPAGKQCMFICAISVSPVHQSRGVGSALIKIGTEKADKDGVSCWVHASEAGHRVFGKAGFTEVGRLEFDLDEFAPGPREEGGHTMSWGNYTFRYMLRHAHPLKV